MGYNPAKAIAYARSKIGQDYKYGGPGRFWDCSELTMKSVKAGDGPALPHRASEQAKQLHAVGNSKVNRKKLRPGDLVFYYGSVHDMDTISHVAIYTGKNKLGQDSVVAAVDSDHGVLEHRMNWALRPSGFGFVGR